MNTHITRAVGYVRVSTEEFPLRSRPGKWVAIKDIPGLISESCRKVHDRTAVAVPTASESVY